MYIKISISMSFFSSIGGVSIKRLFWLEFFAIKSYPNIPYDVLSLDVKIFIKRGNNNGKLILNLFIWNWLCFYAFNLMQILGSFEIYWFYCVCVIHWLCHSYHFLLHFVFCLIEENQRLWHLLCHLRHRIQSLNWFASRLRCDSGISFYLRILFFYLVL